MILNLNYTHWKEITDVAEIFKVTWIQNKKLKKSPKHEDICFCVNILKIHHYAGQHSMRVHLPHITASWYNIQEVKKIFVLYTQWQMRWRCWTIVSPKPVTVIIIIDNEHFGVIVSKHPQIICIFLRFICSIMVLKEIERLDHILAVFSVTFSDKITDLRKLRRISENWAEYETKMRRIWSKIKTDLKRI